jgi:hypothetical protein
MSLLNSEKPGLSHRRDRPEEWPREEAQSHPHATELLAGSMASHAKEVLHTLATLLLWHGSSLLYVPYGSERSHRSGHV